MKSGTSLLVDMREWVLYDRCMSGETSPIAPEKKRVGFRTIVETVADRGREFLKTSGIPERTRVTLSNIAQLNSLLAKESFKDENYDGKRFAQYLGSYTRELQALIDDQQAWDMLPEFISPSEAILDMSTRSLKSLDDPDIYSRSMTAAERSAYADEHREKLLKKIRGEAKEDVRDTFRKYIEELRRDLLELVSPEKGMAN